MEQWQASIVWHTQVLALGIEASRLQKLQEFQASLAAYIR